MTTTLSPADVLRTEATRSLESYLQEFPKEADRMLQLSQQLGTDPGSVFDRKNMRGHIVASAIVLDESHDNVLMIHHGTYDKWLPPGGHVEVDEETSLWGAASREVQEETGLKSMARHAQLAAPFDIDTHPIPANPKKGEGDHFHHDFMYLAVATEAFEPDPQLEEVKAAKWMPREQLRELPDPRMHRLADKLDELCPKQTSRLKPR